MADNNIREGGIEIPTNKPKVETTKDNNSLVFKVIDQVIKDLKEKQEVVQDLLSQLVYYAKDITEQVIHGKRDKALGLDDNKKKKINNDLWEEQQWHKRKLVATKIYLNAVAQGLFSWILKGMKYLGVIAIGLSILTFISQFLLTMFQLAMLGGGFAQAVAVEFFNSLIIVMDFFVRTVIPIMVDVLANILPPAIMTLLNYLPSVLMSLINVIHYVFTRVADLFMSGFFEKFMSAIIKIGNILIQVFITIFGVYLPKLIALIGDFIGKVFGDPKFIQMLVSALTSIVFAIVKILSSIIEVLARVVIPVLVNIIVILLRVIIEILPELLTALVNVIVQSLPPIIEAIVYVLIPALVKAIFDLIPILWNSIVLLFTSLVNIIWDFLTNSLFVLLDKIIAFLVSLGQGILFILKAIGWFLVGLLATALLIALSPIIILILKIVAIVVLLWKFLQNLRKEFPEYFEPLINFFKDTINTIVNKIESFIEPIRNLVSILGDIIKEAIESIPFFNTLMDIMKGIWNFLMNLMNFFKYGFNDMIRYLLVSIKNIFSPENIAVEYARETLQEFKSGKVRFDVDELTGNKNFMDKYSTELAKLNKMKSDLDKMLKDYEKESDTNKKESLKESIQLQTEQLLAQRNQIQELIETSKEQLKESKKQTQKQSQTVQKLDQQNQLLSKDSLNNTISAYVKFVRGVRQGQKQ
ncbi:MAG: hypothetical protein QW350_05615 [Candidatus Aenigmatarchaeota archaeon]